MRFYGIFLTATSVLALASSARAETAAQLKATSEAQFSAPVQLVHPHETIAQSPTQLNNLQITPDGFFIRTQGATPEIVTSRSGDRFVVELQRTHVSTRLDRVIPLNRYGVSNIQVDEGPNATRITFWLSDSDLFWEATASGDRGIILLPRGGLEAAGYQSQRTETLGVVAQTDLATIESVEFRRDGTQVAIEADRPIRYTSGWDRDTLAYKITITGARLADGLEAPERVRFSPVLWVRLRQADPEIVEILIQPAARTEVERATQPNSNTVLVAVEQNNIVSDPPPDRPGGDRPDPKPDPTEIDWDDLPVIDRERVVVVIDPGHGGPDPGAIGRGGLREKDVVLDICLRLTQILERQGVQVVLTRADDRDLYLEPRIQLANRIDADLFVSVHVNAISMSRPDVNGIETYHSRRASRQSRILAGVLHRNIVAAVGGPDRGVRAADFVVIRLAEMPAVLLELGFVTGAADAPRLANPQHRTVLASAVARGILEYIQNDL